MALTISNSKTSVFGNKRISTFDVAFHASSYLAGGEALTLSNMGLSEVDIVLISQKAGYMLEYDYTNKKVKAYRVAATTHAHDLVFKASATTNAVTMAADSLHSAAVGDLTVTGGGADGGIVTKTAAAAAMVEVADATDLGTALASVKFMAIGV